MSAVLKANQDPAHERDWLITQLLDAVKQCQIRFGRKTELATDIDKRVGTLCSVWENIFQHGMRSNTNNKTISTFKQLTHVTGLNKFATKISAIDELKNCDPEPAFWNFVKEHLSRHELQRYLCLKNVQTDSGRGQAWLRSALNEHSLEKYIQMMIGSPDILSQFYESWALLRDEEKSSLLPNMAAGLDSILFAINIDNPSLNVDRSGSESLSFFSSRSSSTVKSVPLDDDAIVHPAIVRNVAPGEVKRDKKRKKRPAKIVTFDGEDLSSCSASPASCLVSPQERIPTESRDVSTCDTQEFIPPTVKEHSVPNGESGPSDADRQSYADHVAQPTKTLNSDLPHRFSFDGIDVHNLRGAAGRDVLQRCCSESNVLSEEPKSKKQPIPTSALGDLDVEDDVELRLRDPSCLDYFSVAAQASDVPLQTNIGCDVGPAVLNSLKGVAGSSAVQLRTLPHSDSVASSASMASVCSQSSNFITCDVDTNISLVPLNAEGKPVELDVTAGSLDGDTTSESYGSYDSHEMPYGDLVHRATHAVSEAEKALSNSLHHSSVHHSSAPGSLNGLQDGLTYDDLKQALIAMMVRKDEAEDRNRRLQVALDAERQSVASLHREIEDQHAAELRRMEKNDDKVRTFTRENELLKNQLKKYVSAVQMLRQGSTVEDLPGIRLDSPQPILPPERLSVDYSFEASEYEKKLIQVAEMHGELMEFNELLQRQLVGREVQLRRVTAELISLRGPLPSEIVASECEVTTNSPGVISNPVLVSTPALINIWIPSAFLRGPSGDAYHVYQVYIHIRNEEWNIYRRYAEFFELHCKLKKKFSSVGSFEFPPKKAFGKKDPKIVEVRRKKLEAYLRQVVHLLVEKTTSLAECPSRQALTSALPFFSDEPKAEKAKHRTRRSRERSSQSSTLNPSPSSEAVNRNTEEQRHHYMGL